MQKEIFAYMFPGMMVMWVFFIGQTAVADLYVERDKKTLMRLAGTPVTIMHIVLSKFAYCFVLCLLVEFVLVLVTTFLFGVDWGNAFWVFVVVSSTNFTMTGILSLLYGIAKSKGAVDGLVVLFILSTGFVSGSFFPYEQMPKLFQQIGDWSVMRWAILGLQAVMHSKPLYEIFLPVAKLLSMGFLTLFGGVYLLRRRMNAGEIV